FPLWNPWQLAGWPFLAAFQTQVFYAPAWAVAWLPPHIAVTAYNVLHWAWAFIGMCAFAAALGLGAAASFAAAGVFAFAGAVTNGFFTHSAGLAACSWLPWASLAAARLTRSTNPTRPLVVFSLVLSMALLAGAPEHFLYLVARVMLVGLWQGSGGVVRSAALLIA